MTPSRTLLFAAVALLASSCGDDGPDEATKEACARWEAIAGTDVSDAEAAAELNAIADLSTNRNVRDKALALAVALEGDVTQTEVGQAYEEMDAACQVAT